MQIELFMKLSISMAIGQEKWVVTSFCFTFVVFQFSNSIIINEISLHFTPLFSYNELYRNTVVRTFDCFSFLCSIVAQWNMKDLMSKRSSY